MNAIEVMDCVVVDGMKIVEGGQIAVAARIGSAVSKLRMEFVEGLLVVRGEVGSFYHKQLIQESLKELPGVEEIANLVQVRPVRGSSLTAL